MAELVQWLSLFPCISCFFIHWLFFFVFQRDFEDARNEAYNLRQEYNKLDQRYRQLKEVSMALENQLDDFEAITAKHDSNAALWKNEK